MARQTRHRPAARHGGPADVDEGSCHGQRLCARFARIPSLTLRAAEDAPPRQARRLHFCHRENRWATRYAQRGTLGSRGYSSDGKPHVLQLVCEGDEEREPEYVDTRARRPQVRPRHRRVRPCVFLRGGRRVHGRMPRSHRARRRPPLPQQARLRPTAHRPQNSGGGSGTTGCVKRQSVNTSSHCGRPCREGVHVLAREASGFSDASSPSPTPGPPWERGRRHLASEEVEHGQGQPRAQRMRHHEQQHDRPFRVKDDPRRAGPLFASRTTCDETDPPACCHRACRDDQFHHRERNEVAGYPHLAISQGQEELRRRRRPSSASNQPPPSDAAPPRTRGSMIMAKSRSTSATDTVGRSRGCG